ncbi:MAG: helix-turn-helix domain-containing protein, partial [Candidatus Doudnabacteria bacterium]
MDENEEQKNSWSNSPQKPLDHNKPGIGFFASNGQSEAEGINEDFLSLSEAGKITGYHQDYLGFLCRTGKLKGFKIGRNWVTTNSALEEFLKNYKNGISEITDESGKKIQVHVQKDKPSVLAENKNLNANPTVGNILESAPAILPSKNLKANTVSQNPDQIIQLTKLKREIFDELENRIESLNLNLSKLESKVASAKTSEEALEQKIAKDKNALVEKAYVLPPTVSPRYERNELSEKFISNFSLDRLSEDFNSTPAPLSKFALTKEKVKHLYKSFAVPRQHNLPVVFASLAIALLGLVGSLLWSNISTQTQLAQKSDLTKYVYQGSLNQNSGITNQGATVNQTVVNNNIANQVINKVLGLTESQVYSFIDQRLNKYLAEGKFKGDKGDTGAAGVSGGVSTITYIQPNSGTGNSGGSMTGVTYLSSENFVTNNATVNNLLTVNGVSNFTGAVTMAGPTILNGTTTIANLTVTNLNTGFEQGSLIFQGVNGLAQDSGNLFYSASTTQLAVGTSTPVASAILQLESTNKGFLAPRMTTLERDAIVSPVAGLMVFNNDTNAYNVYNGTAWGAIGSGSGNGNVATGTPGSVAYYTATSTTVSPQNTLFVIGGNVGVGTSTPEQKLVVTGDARITGALFDSSNASGTNGMILQTTGTGTQWIATSSLGIIGGIQSLNGLSTLNQTFTTSTSGGLQLNITSSGSTHTFALQPATGYTVPLTASTSEWSTFYNTPSTRITATDNLTWIGNSLGIAAGYNIPLNASTTNWNSAYNIVTASSSNWTTAYNTVTASSTYWDTAYQNRITSATAPLQISSNNIGLQPGYNIPLSASTTNWNNFFNNPSSFLTAGSNIVISGTSTIAVSANPSFTSITSTNASTSALTVSGPLWVTGQSTLGNTSSTALTVSGNTNLATTTATRLTFTNASGSTVSLTGNITAANLSGTNTGDVTLAGQNYLSLSGQQITANQINLTSNVTGILPVVNGGTGTSTLASGEILLGNGAGGIISTPILSVSKGGTGSSSLNTTLVAEGNNLYYLDSRARGAISSSALGLTYTSGTGVFSLTSGYGIPLSASTTEWSNFYTSPSTRISAGTGLSWAGNILNSTLQPFATTTIAGINNTNFILATGTATGIGLTISTSTNIITLTPTVSAGYIIPLSASTTNWNTAYNIVNASSTLWDSAYANRITSATAPLQISSNNIGLQAGYNIPLTASTTEWTNLASNPVWKVGNGVVYNATSTDNVGIGTTSPIAKLDVWGNLNVSTGSTPTLFVDTATGNVRIGTTSPSSSLFVVQNDANHTNSFQVFNSSGQSQLSIANNGVLSSNLTANFNALNVIGGTNITSTNNINAIPLSVYTGATQNVDIMRISGPSGVGRILTIPNNGLVGIGTTSPIATLSVMGTSSAPTVNPFVVASSSGAQLLTVLPNGNVGIGTSTPTNLLHLNGTASVNTIQINGPSNGRYVQLQMNDTADTATINSSNNIGFGIGNASSPTRIMNVTSAGLGIGTTTPTQKLVVVGDARITGSLFDSSNASGTTGMLLSSTGTGTSWISTSSLGLLSGAITSLNGQTGSTQTFATGTATGIGLTVTSAGNIHTFTPTISAGYIIPLSASTTNWNTAYNIVNASSTNWDSAYTNRITSATAPLQISANNIGLQAGYNIPLTASTTQWATLASNPVWVTGNGKIYNATSTDNVGIGTSSPVAKLDVWGNLNVGTSSTPTLFVNSATGRVGIGKSNPAYALDVAGSVGISGTLWMSSGQSIYNDNFRNAIPSSSMVFQGRSSSSDFIFQDLNASPIVTIKNNGLVGIGTTSPIATLSVMGTSSAPTVNPFVVASSTGTQLLTVLPSGYVGIGATNPSVPLEVQTANNGGSVTYAMTLRNPAWNAGQGVGMKFWAGTQTGSNLQTAAITSRLVDSTNGNLYFDTTYNGVGSTRLTIQSDGNVGIGTTTPTARLSVTSSGTVNPFSITSSSGVTLLEVDNVGNFNLATLTASSLVFTDSNKNLTST